MYKIPTANESVAHVIARRRLGVYAIKPDLVGRAVDDDGWKHTLYEITLYRLDTKHIDGRRPDVYNGKFRMGTGYGDLLPSAEQYIESVWMDVDTYELISDRGTATDLDILQNYVNEYGYDHKDPAWLKKAIGVVTELKNSYPGLITIFGEDFTARAQQAMDEIREETGEQYEFDTLWELICVDPDEDELEKIGDGNYDHEEIRKRYSTAL